MIFVFSLISTPCAVCVFSSHLCGFSLPIQRHAVTSAAHSKLHRSRMNVRVNGFLCLSVGPVMNCQLVRAELSFSTNDSCNRPHAVHEPKRDKQFHQVDGWKFKIKCHKDFHECLPFLKNRNKYLWYAFEHVVQLECLVFLCSSCLLLVFLVAMVLHFISWVHLSVATPAVDGTAAQRQLISFKWECSCAHNCVAWLFDLIRFFLLSQMLNIYITMQHGYLD